MSTVNIKSFIFFCAILKSVFAFAQYKITGKIEDTSQKAIQFANVILYENGNEKPITGVISNVDGTYLFTNVKAGTYQVEISVLGFESQKSTVFTISEEAQQKKIDFVMSEEIQSLDTLEIKTTRPIIRQTAEKLIVDIEKSEMANTNLNDVMRRVPGIIVTNGNISYAGQGGVQILINGKSTNYMDINTLLTDFPADNIARVELIHQPGAEFDAEGSGPIINIILKKNVKLGTNGNLVAYTGYEYRQEYDLSASLSSYKSKVNWQVSAGYSKPTWLSELFIKRKVNDEVYDQATISPYKPTNFRASGALDYYINDNHSIGFSIGGNKTDSERTSENRTTVIGNNISELLATENAFDREQTVFNINPYYEYEDEKNKLNLDYNFVDYKNDNLNNLYQVGQSTIAYDNQRYLQKGTYTINTLEANYTHTSNDNFNWSLGAKYSTVKTDNDLNSFVQNTNSDFELDTNQSNRFFVNEDILAFYAKASYTYKKWSFSGGVRWEESETNGTSTNPQQTRSRNISKFFPSANLVRKINDNINASLSYSYRIDRPSYNSLNSFVYYYDPFTFEEGNPNLTPSFTDSFQFNLTYNDRPFFTIGYKNTTDTLFELITQDDASAQSSRTIINLAENRNWNFRVFGPLNFLEGLEGFTGLIVNYNEFKSSELNPQLNLSKWSLTWYTNVEYELPWNIHSELNGFYSTGGLQGQIEHDWLAGMNFVISKKFYKNQLKVNLGIDQILNRKFNGQVNYSNIDATIEADWARQVVYCLVAYSFGSKFKKKKGRGDSSKDEEERIKDNH